MPLQKYPCWITNANFAVDNSLNLHIIRFYRRKWLLSSVRNDKSRLRFSVCSGIYLYNNPMRGVPETAEAAMPQT